MKRLKRKIVLVLIIIIGFILSATYSYCTEIDDETMKSQQDTFGITSFIENAKQYTGEFFEDIDIKDVFNSAVKGEIDNSKIYN